jgi:hypothetical protein
MYFYKIQFIVGLTKLGVRLSLKPGGHAKA